MADAVAVVRNLSRKAAVRLLALHKPFVRMARRRGRAAERAAMVDDAERVEREIARVCAGTGPIVAGPWLGEVGYEALYWLPFLRWVQDRYRVRPERLTVVSRGGVEHWYDGIAGRYIDLFDLVTPAELATRNEARQSADEGGGRKQSRPSELDDWLLQRAGVAGGNGRVAVLHPSMLFRMFRDVWQGNLPLDFLLTRADFAVMARPPRPACPGLPDEYVAVKFYSGTALADTADNVDLVRAMVRRIAAHVPVVVLDTGLAVDDHRDYTFEDIPGAISARQWMTPRTNLGLQSALIAHARYFLGTCGGLAWLAPFAGVPTVAVFADDAFLRPHLTIARLAGTRVGAAEFSTLDLRAVKRVMVPAS